jgi:tight adherence protein B
VGVPVGEVGEQWQFPQASGQAGSGRGTAILGAVARRLPGAARRERAAKEAAVPEVLDILHATIVAGAAPYRALLAAAETAPEPLAPALDTAARTAAVGLGAGQALATAGRDHGLVELVVAGEALDLAETTGAPPAPVLAGVAAAATDRLRTRQSRMAATAQARLAARVVSGMAPCFLLVLAATSPADAAFLVRERLGWVTLAAATTFEAAGIWWAGRIVGGGP